MLTQMQRELQGRAPDARRLVEAAVAREQVVQEERNRKALELLLSKDREIQDLQDKILRLQSDAELLRATGAEALERAAAAEAQAVALLRDKDQQRREADAEREQLHAKMVCSHKTEVGPA